jgi:hypothetical protein
VIADERQKRQMAEATTQGCRTQQGQLAKEKNDLEQKVKRLEGAEGDLRRMSQSIEKLQSENSTLKVCCIHIGIEKKGAEVIETGISRGCRCAVSKG